MTKATVVKKTAKKNLLKKAKGLSASQKEKYEVQNQNTIKVKKDYKDSIRESFKTTKGKTSFASACEVANLQGESLSRSIYFCLLIEKLGKSFLNRIEDGINGTTTRKAVKVFCEKFLGGNYKAKGKGLNCMKENGNGVNKKLFTQLSVEEKK